jgi:hypothetical protein
MKAATIPVNIYSLNFNVFYLFWKNESRLMRSPWPQCVCVLMCVPPPPINFWMPEPVLMKLGVYIMAPESISTAYFIINPSISLCVCMRILPIIARQQLGKHIPTATNTLNNRIIVGCTVFCAVCIISKESLWECLCIPLLSQQLGKCGNEEFLEVASSMRSMSYQRKVGN